MLDHEIVEKFKEFQQKTGKYLDLVIEDVLFEKVRLSHENHFKFIKGKNKYIQTYITKNSGEYPILGSSLKNSCISAYIKFIDLNDVINEKCVSFNKDNGKGSIPFFRDYPFLMDRHHIAIIPTALVDVEYLQKSLIRYFENKRFGWGDNVATVDEVSKHIIPVPKNLNKKYTSLKLQKIIVEFLEHGFNWLDGIKANIDKQNDIYKRLRKSLIPSTFKKDYIKIRFTRYAKKYDIDFNITDIEFEVKRIHADKENKNDLICSKSMGFTPKTNANGDINWFSVKDLGQINGFFIDNPNTNKKTTMKLIKETVDKKNTGKSEKLIPIKKGDILISFKLTVGVVKVYNSDKPAYCNEAIDILTVNNDIYNEYVAYNCILEYPKYGTSTNNGLTLNDDSKKEIKIFIPKSLENYTSYEIQKIIAGFINEVGDEIQQSFEKINKGYDAVKRYKRAYLYKTFSKIDWSK